MEDPKDLFTLDYFKEMLSDCTDVGASLYEKDGTFTLLFPKTNLGDEFYFSFSLLDEATVGLFSSFPSMEGFVAPSEFLEGLDVVSEKLLTFYDGVDRDSGEAQE